jgi:hypothetical protein
MENILLAKLILLLIWLLKSFVDKAGKRGELIR